MLKEPGQFPAQDIPNDDEQLTMRDLTVGYDRIPLIKNINLGVRPGEILTLIGPNGSGKSTILKTITKQLKTIGGSVFLGKESMRELTDSEISRHLSICTAGFGTLQKSAGCRASQGRSLRHS